MPEPAGRASAAVTGRDVQAADLFDGVVSSGGEIPVWLRVKWRRRPWLRHGGAKQLLLKPQVLHPAQMLDDAADGQLRRGQQLAVGVAVAAPLERGENAMPMKVEKLL